MGTIEGDGGAGTEEPADIDYERLVHDALVGVVRNVLAKIAGEGLPGDHHLYVSFRSRHPGVDLPAALARRFPEEMTIVLQNQFWNLVVEQERFAVTLRFAGAPARLTIPFAALLSVVDPSVPFGLRFGASAQDADPAAASAQAPGPEAAAKGKAGVREARATVVDFDAFRRRE